MLKSDSQKKGQGAEAMVGYCPHIQVVIKFQAFWRVPRIPGALEGTSNSREQPSSLCCTGCSICPHKSLCWADCFSKCWNTLSQLYQSQAQHSDPLKPLTTQVRPSPVCPACSKNCNSQSKKQLGVRTVKICWAWKWKPHKRCVISSFVRISLHLKGFNNFCHQAHLFLFSADKLKKFVQE